MKRYFLFLLVFFTVFQVVLAQDSTNDDLFNIKLPPINTLLENAKKSPMFEFYNYRMEGQELNLKTEKRKWLEYFSIAGTYQYGVMGMASYTDLGYNYPVIYQNSGGQQLWYNIGVGARIPLDKLFDRRNRIKLQQLKIQETLKERDLWYDQQKRQIIELYNKAEEILVYIKLIFDQSTLSNSLYENTKKEYIMGTTTIQALNNANAAASSAFLSVIKVKSELKNTLMQLEIVSSTKIFN